jgi:hypothetical protein
MQGSFDSADVRFVNICSAQDDSWIYKFARREMVLARHQTSAGGAIQLSPGRILLGQHGM